MRLGILGVPPHNLVELHDHIINSSWPPGICDLSADLIAFSPFSVYPPDTLLYITQVSNHESYLVEVTHRCCRASTQKVLLSRLGHAQVSSMVSGFPSLFTLVTD